MDMMKIGTFSKKYDVSFYTIRFYIKEGLLLPERKNNQYYFDLRCEEDMMLILELRECRFSLKEMSRILSVKRLSGFQDADSIHFLKGMMKGKQEELKQEIEEMREAIGLLDEKQQQLVSLSEQEKQSEVEGIPIEFLYHLNCPICGRAFELEESKLHGTTILKGKLTCNCGYRAEIKDGVITTSHIDQEAEVWYTIDSLIQKFSQEYLNVMFQCYNWMYNEILDLEVRNKVILCNGENGAEFLYQYMSKLGKDNLYIITEVSPNTIRQTKNRLSQKLQGYRILYVVCDGAELPLKPESVDLLIDDGTSWYDMFDSREYFLEKVLPVLKPQVDIIGFYPSYSKKALSVKNIKLLFPEANISRMNWSSMKQNLQDNGMELVTDKLMGEVSDCGTWAKYHVQGEKIHMHVYRARALEDR
ncbi:MAG: MerR family transcriptional regulator [Lachnospiraceae bacterium]